MTRLSGGDILLASLSTANNQLNKCLSGEAEVLRKTDESGEAPATEMTEESFMETPLSDDPPLFSNFHN